jgi:hypothetical protein
LYVIAGLAAIAFERSRNRALLGQAEAARQSEELKSIAGCHRARIQDASHLH